MKKKMKSDRFKIYNSEDALKLSSEELFDNTCVEIESGCIFFF